MIEDPIQRTAKLILFQSQRDHATELVIRRRPGNGAAIRYKVSDNWHDWSSPDSEHAPAIIDEIGRLAAFTKRPCPKEGLIDEPYCGVRLLWVVRMVSADGDCILSSVDQ